MEHGGSPRLVSVGSIVADIRLDVPHLPARGGDVIGSAATVAAGGGFNILCAAARQGMATIFAGWHGTGRYGDCIRSAFAREGIATFHPPVPDGDSGFCMVMVEPDGERTFVSSPGVEAVLGQRRLSEVPLVAGDTVFVSGYDLCYPDLGPAIAGWAGEMPRGARLVVDPGPLAAGIPDAILRDVMPQLSILTMNRREAGLLTGETDASAVWSRLRPRLRADAWLILRDGAAGAFLCTGGEAVRVPSPPVTMVDSTGAGDTHTGVFIASLAQGLDPIAAMRRANAAAAISVTRRGPATAPDRAELELFLALEQKESLTMSISRRAVLAAGALLALPSIARAESSTQAFKGKTLTVASWQDYGADDPATLKMFEDMTGATVKDVYFTSEDDLLEMLREGGIGKIDVVLPNLEYVKPAAQQGLLQPIDTAKIAAWTALEARFSGDPSIRLNGHVYAVPWVQGATSLAVNPTVEPIPNSWAVLWDPANKGKVAFFDDPSTAVMTAALYLGEDPQNPDLAKIRTALLDLKKNVKLFWSSGDDWNKAYTTGEITMGNLWSGLAGTLKKNGHALNYILPDDGTVVWGDTWAIVKNTPNPDLAYAWVNFLTSPEYFTQWITNPGPNQELAVPVNEAAVQALPPSAANALLAGELLDYKGKVALQTGIAPRDLKKWTELWEDVKAS